VIHKEQALELIRDIFLSVAVFGLFGVAKKVNIVGLHLLLTDFNRHKNISLGEFIEFVQSLHNQRLHEYLFVVDGGDLQLI
jgi:hypothetical protein